MTAFTLLLFQPSTSYRRPLSFFFLFIVYIVVEKTTEQTEQTETGLAVAVFSARQRITKKAKNNNNNNKKNPFRDTVLLLSSVKRAAANT